MQKAMDKIRNDISVNYKSGKLKDSHIKKFLTNYYDGNPNDVVKGSNKTSMLETYVMIQQDLVGDDLKQHAVNTVYERNGKKYCCGKRLYKQLRKGYPYCEICGTEY